MSEIENIKEILDNISKKHNVDILYAVEAGSRAWGFESVDSDYDIRFIFKHKHVTDYLSLNDPVCLMTIDGFSSDRKYDWQGWDIRKALVLLKQTNPSLVEWLYSPIIYYTDGIFAPKAVALLESVKHVKPLLYHYRSMAKSNYMNHINKQTLVASKKYLYVIRPAAMLLWLQIKNRSKYMDIEFKNVLKDIENILDESINDSILKIIEAKKLKNEMDECKRIECIDKWLDSLVLDKNEFNIDESNRVSINQYEEIFFTYFDLHKPAL